MIQLYQKKKGYFEFENLMEWIIFVFAIIVTVDFAPCSDVTSYRYVSIGLKNTWNGSYLCLLSLSLLILPHVTI